MNGRPASHKGVFFAFVCVVTVVYVFLATGGTMTRFPTYMQTYYQELAAGFADGHTYLIHRPGVLPANVMQNRYWDLSIHDGKLYLYWGPIPALIMAPLLRIWGWHLADAHMVFAFLLGRAVFGGLLLMWILRDVSPRHTRDTREGVLPLIFGFAALTFGWPAPWLMSRPTVYEAAISGAQFFMVAGLCFAYGALKSARSSCTRALAAGAGVCWGLAVGCRGSHLLTAGALTLLTIGAMNTTAKPSARRRTLLGDSLALGAPLTLACVLYAFYNYVRFGSPFETGIQSQISNLAMLHFGMRFLPTNLLSYFFNPFHIGSHFPFLRVLPANALWQKRQWAFVPADAYYERAIGFFWVMPSCVFAVGAVVVLWRWCRRVHRRGLREATIDARTVRLTWFCASAISLAVVGFAPCAFAFAIISRYTMDMTTGVALASAVGFAVLRERGSTATRSAVTAAAALTTLVSIVASLATWVEGSLGGFLRAHNSQLFAALESAFR